MIIHFGYRYPLYFHSTSTSIVSLWSLVKCPMLLQGALTKDHGPGASKFKARVLQGLVSKEELLHSLEKTGEEEKERATGEA